MVLDAGILAIHEALTEASPTPRDITEQRGSASIILSSTAIYPGILATTADGSKISALPFTPPPPLPSHPYNSGFSRQSVELYLSPDNSGPLSHTKIQHPIMGIFSFRKRSNQPLSSVRKVKFAASQSLSRVKDPRTAVALDMRAPSPFPRGRPVKQYTVGSKSRVAVGIGKWRTTPRRSRPLLVKKGSLGVEESSGSDTASEKETKKETKKGDRKKAKPYQLSARSRYERRERFEVRIFHICALGMQRTDLAGRAARRSCDGEGPCRRAALHLAPRGGRQFPGVSSEVDRKSSSSPARNYPLKPRGYRYRHPSHHLCSSL